VRDAARFAERGRPTIESPRQTQPPE